MSHGWDTRTAIETAVSHQWARRIQHEPPILAAARNVLNNILLPIFTNESVSDDAIRPSSTEEDCGGNLLEHQITKQVIVINKLAAAVDNATTEQKKTIGEGIRC